MIKSHFDGIVAWTQTRLCFPQAFGHRFHEHSATYSTVIRPVCHDGLRGNLKLPILLVLSAKGEGVGKVANEEDRRCIAA